MWVVERDRESKRYGGYGDRRECVFMWLGV